MDADKPALGKLSLEVFHPLKGYYFMIGNVDAYIIFESLDIQDAVYVYTYEFGAIFYENNVVFIIGLFGDYVIGYLSSRGNGQSLFYLFYCLKKTFKNNRLK